VAPEARDEAETVAGRILQQDRDGVASQIALEGLACTRHLLPRTVPGTRRLHLATYLARSPYELMVVAW